MGVLGKRRRSYAFHSSGADVPIPSFADTSNTTPSKSRRTSSRETCLNISAGSNILIMARVLACVWGCHKFPWTLLYPICVLTPTRATFNADPESTNSTDNSPDHGSNDWHFTLSHAWRSGGGLLWTVLAELAPPEAEAEARSDVYCHFSDATILSTSSVEVMDLVDSFSSTSIIGLGACMYETCSRYGKNAIALSHNLNVPISLPFVALVFTIQ